MPYLRFESVATQRHFHRARLRRNVSYPIEFAPVQFPVHKRATVPAENCIFFEPCIRKRLGQSVRTVHVAATGIPNILHKNVEFFIKSSSGAHLRLVSAYRNARAGNFCETADKSDGHLVYGGVYHYHPVFSTAARNESALACPDLLFKNLRIDKIVIVTCRNAVPLSIEPYARIGILSVKESYVRNVPALAQHKAAAAQIVYPRTCLFRPGIVTVEPLSVDSQTKSRNVIVRRLVNAAMYDEPVEALRHSVVGKALEISRMTLVCPVSVPFAPLSVGCERLRSAQILTIYVCHRSGLPDIRHASGISGIPSRP